MLARSMLAEEGLRSGDEAQALERLVGHLVQQGYHFITPTPASHARVLAREGSRVARDLREAFGWSMVFPDTLLDAGLLAGLHAAGLVERAGAAWKSRVRVSTLGEDLFVHSAFPTEEQDAVFFGPDSYRFADLIRRELARCPQRPGARLVDIGTGAGVGAIVAARMCPQVEIIATDINPAALRIARINARIAGVRASLHCAGDLSAIDGPLDVVLANPPYIIDEADRAYRNGGDMHGAQIALEMAGDALPRLAPRGRFLLYTGSAILDGRDPLRERLSDLSRQQGCTLRYAEVDPDIFGEELETPAYRDVERIALVNAIVERER